MKGAMTEKVRYPRDKGTEGYIHLHRSKGREDGIRGFQETGKGDNI